MIKVDKTAERIIDKGEKILDTEGMPVDKNKLAGINNCKKKCSSYFRR